MNNVSMQVIHLKNQGQVILPFCYLVIAYINIVLISNYMLNQMLLYAL